MKVHESEYGTGQNNFHVDKCEDLLSVVLTYPPYTDADNTNKQCRYVYVNQESVRASDGIRLHYDFQRDGIVIEQEPQDENGEVGPWQEVAFIKSWALDKTKEEAA